MYHRGARGVHTDDKLSLLCAFQGQECNKSVILSEGHEAYVFACREIDAKPSQQYLSTCQFLMKLISIAHSFQQILHRPSFRLLSSLQVRDPYACLGRGPPRPSSLSYDCRASVCLATETQVPFSTGPGFASLLYQSGFFPGMTSYSIVWLSSRVHSSEGSGGGGFFGSS